MRIVRKIERDGTWWAQARDGSWFRWDTRASDWVPASGGPPGGAEPLQVDATEPHSPPPGPGAGSIAWAFVTTFAAIWFPAFFGLGIALALHVGLAFVWNTFFVPWLGSPVRSSDVIVLMLIGTVAIAFFLAVGVTIRNVHPTTGATWLAGAVVAVGAVGTVLVIASVRDVGVIELLTRKETAMAVVLVAVGWGGLALRRWLAEV